MRDKVSAFSGNGPKLLVSFFNNVAILWLVKQRGKCTSSLSVPQIDRFSLIAARFRRSTTVTGGERFVLAGSCV